MLERIQKANDIKKLAPEELPELAQEIRQFLIEKISRTGGHLASNLGVVELTMAIHLVFDLPKDKIIWDVGHQSYTHKILTGRKDGFDDLRKYGGMSGFPKRKESACDAFDTGHSSTSISAGLGYVCARDLQKEDYSVISVIGDGSLTGGMAYEALNNASRLKKNFIIVLNDNHMSISENVGGMSDYLAKLRTADFYTDLKKGVTNMLHNVPVVGDPMIEHIRKTKSSLKQLIVPGMFFEDMGITYLGPIQGHSIPMLVRALKEARKIEGPVLLHVLTKKGKGYEPAEEQPDKFHGIGPFQVETGEPEKPKKKDSYTDVFGKVMCDEAARNDKLAAITAAMADGTGLARFRKKYPNRFFDVGIAEEHAVTFAAGLAKAGMKPFVAVYSTFLQRAYDHIMEDVCLQELPVVLCIDRAGIVGNDGETHHGVFDLSYLKHIPGLTVMAPKDGSELEAMLEFAASFDRPCAIRYPRGAAPQLGAVEDMQPVQPGRVERLRSGSDVDIWAFGAMVEKALEAAELLEAGGISAGVVNTRFLCPLDNEALEAAAGSVSLIATAEDNVIPGGLGEEINDVLKNSGTRIMNIGWPDTFIEHGTCGELYSKYGMDGHSIAERIKQEFERKT